MEEEFQMKTIFGFLGVISLVIVIFVFFYSIIFGIVGAITLVIMILVIYHYMKSLETFKSDTVEKVSSPQLCTDVTDCDIRDPCTKINCHYHLDPSIDKCRPKHMHQSGYEEDCPDNILPTCKQAKALRNIDNTNKVKVVTKTSHNVTSGTNKKCVVSNLVNIIFI